MEHVGREQPRERSVRRWKRKPGGAAGAWKCSGGEEAIGTVNVGQLVQQPSQGQQLLGSIILKRPSFRGGLVTRTVTCFVKTTVQRLSFASSAHYGTTLKPQKCFEISDRYSIKCYLTNSPNTVFLFSVWSVDSG